MPAEPPNKYVCDGCLAKARPRQLAEAQARRRAKVRQLLSRVAPPGSVVLDEAQADALREGLRLALRASDRHEAVAAAVDESNYGDGAVLDAQRDLADAAADAATAWRDALPPGVLPEDG